MDAREEKLQELMKNETFVKELSTKIEAEDAQKYFAEHGVDFTMDEMKAMGNALNKMKQKERELTEEDLNEVSGGFLATATIISILMYGGLFATGAAVTFGTIFHW